MFLLINDNVLYRDDVCEMLASQLRKVYQTIVITKSQVSNLTGEGIRMIPELTSLTGLMQKFKEKITFVVKQFINL